MMKVLRAALLVQLTLLSRGAYYIVETYDSEVDKNHGVSDKRTHESHFGKNYDQSNKSETGSDYEEEESYEYEYKDEESFRSGGLDAEECNCGKMDLESVGEATRIVGGKEAKKDNHPWQVSFELGSGENHCGGTLISKRHVLTAAHCTRAPDASESSGWAKDGDVTKDPSLLTVVLGLHSKDQPEEAQRIEISKVHLPTSAGFSWKKLAKEKIHDVALIELKKDAKLSPKVLPICLPSVKKSKSGGSDYKLGEAKSHVGQTAIVRGWGDVNQRNADQRAKRRRFRRSPDSEKEGILREAEIKIISNDECQKKYKAPHFMKILPTFICGYTPGVDACQGDSGGPLSIQEVGRQALVGVVGAGMGCADPNFPGIYTRVSKYLTWIKKITSGYTVWDSSCKKI